MVSGLMGGSTSQESGVGASKSRSGRSALGCEAPLKKRDHHPHDRIVDSPVEVGVVAGERLLEVRTSVETAVGDDCLDAAKCREVAARVGAQEDEVRRGAGSEGPEAGQAERLARIAGRNPPDRLGCETRSGQTTRYISASAWCWKRDLGMMSARMSSTGGMRRPL